MRPILILTAALLACGAASAQKPQCANGKQHSADCHAPAKPGKNAKPARPQADPLGIRAPGQSSLYDLNPNSGGLGASSMHPSGGASGGLRSPGGMQPPRGSR